MFVTIATMSISRWTAAELPDLHGRTVIITGANSGIGRATATALADAGASVTLAVRDATKGGAAAAWMKEGRQTFERSTSPI